MYLLIAGTFIGQIAKTGLFYIIAELMKLIKNLTESTRYL